MLKEMACIGGDAKVKKEMIPATSPATSAADGGPERLKSR